MHYYYYSILFLILFATSTLAKHNHHPCTDKFHELVKANNLSNCHRLPTLGAELGWTNPSSSSREKSHHVFQVLFGAPLDAENRWLAWGVNPGPQPEMVGTRAVIGIKNPSNATLSCKTYNITHDTRIGCQLHPTPLDEIKCTEFHYDKTTQYHVFSASLNLSSKHYNVSRLNIVWQIGFDVDVDGDMPKKHVTTLKNVDSTETLDLINGKSFDMAHVKVHLRKVHGVLNIIGWGTLLPVGAIIARFFRKHPFEMEDWWYYTHVVCQCTGFIIGVVGWGIGMWFARISPRYSFHTHHVFAVFIFAFATLQTLAIRFRPSLEDDFRKVWNIYHHFLGYSLITLIFINIFEGIRILKPENKENWRMAVVGILIGLGTITLILEIYTWIKFFNKEKEKRKTNLESLSHPPSKLEEEDQQGESRSSLSRRNNSLFTSPALEA